MQSPRTLVVAAAALAALTLTSCAGGDGPADTSSNAPLSAEILLPYPPALPATAPLTVAQEKGMFKDAGIEVTYSVADGSGYLSQQLVAGNTDFALMSAADAVVAFSKRDDVRALFCHQVSNIYRVAATADSGVTEISELEGKALGFTETGGGEYQLVNSAIAEAGLVPNESITLVPVGGAGPQSLTALQDGTIQAYASSFPDFAVLAAEGIEWVDITPEKYANVPGACLITTEEVLATADGLAAAKAIASGWVNALYFTIEDPDGALEVVCTTAPEACENRAVAEALVDELVKVITPAEGHRPGELRLDSWQTVAEMLAASGTVDPSLDVSPLISGSAVEAVTQAAYEGRG